MTLTERGILGFLDGSQSVGSGFVYPASENNLLYIGGLWVGLEPEYVANRDYDADPAREWQVASDPDGHVWIHPYGSSDQDIHAAFDDAGAVQPRGLRVAQESWAFADPANDDYVILRYTVENTGTTDWSSVYAGVFLDLDLGDALDDVGGVDQIRDLVYLTDANGIHAGLRVLSGVREGDGTPGHEPIANITLVDNETYVWPLAYVPDGEKHAFLAASDPAHVLSVSPDPGDYSLLASLGPFELAPGEAREVAFAVVGGASLASLGTHADAAQIAYLHPVGLAEPSAAPTRARILFNSPNPFANGTSIGFSVPAPCPIRLQVFDSQGRCLRSLYDGPASPGLHVIVWDGRDQRGRVLAAGIYYVRLRAGAEEDSRGLLLIR